MTVGNGIEVLETDEQLRSGPGRSRPRAGSSMASSPGPRTFSLWPAGADGAARPLRGEPVVAAAYLHDIGYAPGLRETGLHQIDGALWLAERAHDDLACLVAHHTCADVELELRGLTRLLDPFPRPPNVLRTYSPTATSPQARLAKR